MTAQEPVDFTVIDDFDLLSEQEPDTNHVFVPVDGVLTKVFRVTVEEATNQVFFHDALAVDKADA